MDCGSVLLIEPFYSGSHKQLIDLLHSEIPESRLFSLPGKKWHWKARTSALYLSQAIPQSTSYRMLFASSVLNLSELIALRPDLGKLWKVLYFHENQLVYPVRKHQDRDFQYGYNQIIACMVADRVIFNSKYNMESFLSSISSFLKLIPDHRPKGIPEMIRPRCCVLNFPIAYLPDQIVSKTLDDEKDACPESQLRKGDEIKTCCVNKKDNRYTYSGTGDCYKEDEHCLNMSDSIKCISNDSDGKYHDSSNVEYATKSEFCDPNDINTCTCLCMNTEEEKRNSVCTDKYCRNYRNESMESECVQSESHLSLQECGRSHKKQQKLSTEMNTCNKSLTDYKEDVDLCQTVNESEGQFVETDDDKKQRIHCSESEKLGFGENFVSSSPEKTQRINDTSQEKPLHIVWPHRWEHDKGPESFFSVMYRLDDQGLNFHLSVLGEQFTDVPEIFEEAKKRLGAKILHWGYQDTKDEYFEVLRQADCVVSTALHEFFGVAMLEAVYCGCYPLCPNRLVYPEIFPDEYLYNTDNQLFKKLREFCKRPSLCRNHQLKIDAAQYSWQTLKKDYKNLFARAGTS